MAARQGLSVLILDLDRSEGNVGAKGVSGTRGFSRKGPLLEFSSNFYIGLGGIEGTRGLFSECLSMLDIPPEQWAEQIREDEAIQIITPDLRIRSTPEPSGLLRELRRELGDPVMASLGLPGAVAAARQPVSSFWNRLSGELGP